MELRLFKSVWAHAASSVDAARSGCREEGFDGVEGPAPASPADRKALRQHLAGEGLAYIAEICTAGSYVPEPHTSVAQHLASFREHAEAAVECDPLFLTVLAGMDAWTLAESVDFFGAADEFARSIGAAASFETHRSRSMFNPWITRDILRALPELRLTCDFSHWCCVCERLVLDEEPELLALFASRARHVHARVGYDQGPQVPHPAAPEYASALAAHERWWDAIWQVQQERNEPFTTMTPEAGPDGYLHCIPFTAQPVGDLAEINQWMARRQRERFAVRHSARLRKHPDNRA